LGFLLWDVFRSFQAPPADATTICCVGISLAGLENTHSVRRAQNHRRPALHLDGELRKRAARLRHNLVETPRRRATQKESTHS
jgi:hypothetical protein